MEQGASGMEQGAWSMEQGARSKGHGARGMEQGVWSKIGSFAKVCRAAGFLVGADIKWLYL
jgi:hypothetical protein